MGLAAPCIVPSAVGRGKVLLASGTIAVEITRRRI